MRESYTFIKRTRASEERNLCLSEAVMSQHEIRISQSTPREVIHDRRDCDIGIRYRRGDDSVFGRQQGAAQAADISISRTTVCRRGIIAEVYSIVGIRKVPRQCRPFSFVAERLRYVC